LKIRSPRPTSRECRKPRWYREESSQTNSPREGFEPAELQGTIRAMETPTNFYPRPFFFRKVPSWSSVNACCSCACVFITIGPYHATGSSSGFPETSRKRIPSSPA